MEVKGTGIFSYKSNGHESIIMDLVGYIYCIFSTLNCPDRPESIVRPSLCPDASLHLNPDALEYG